ncbi:conjugative transposon protein TraM [Capnocytophaga canimorsus]|uniref:conjugative transposon protein TraM n=1 Tax=Capnocytophaga canimorsus TaxID=28188 RepID=UPI0037CE1DCD
MKQPQKKQNVLIEKAKNVDTPMYLIGGIFLICIIVIFSGLFSEDEPTNTELNNEMGIPESREAVENYNSKLQAYQQQERQKNNLSLDFNKGFFSEKDTIQEEDITQDERFKDLQKQVEGNTAPASSTAVETTKKGTQNKVQSVEKKPQTKGVSSTSKRVARQEPQIKQEPINKQEYDVESAITNVEIKQEPEKPKTEVKKRKVGQKLTFEDLPQTEQRRILLQTGQRTYQESSEIRAKIISSGEVKAGQTIRLMLQEDAVLSFKLIPRGTTISGIVSFNENRMRINFSTIRLKTEIVKVNLDLYAMDGLVGLPISGESHTKESEDEGIDEAISRTGRVGRIVGGIAKSIRRSKDISVNLGNDVACILVNNNIEE